MEMINLFKQILQEQELILKNYKQDFLQVWKNWVEEYGGAEVADFFVKNCDELILKWLSVIFPFRKEDFKIIISALSDAIIIPPTVCKDPSISRYPFFPCL